MKDQPVSAEDILAEANSVAAKDEKDFVKKILNSESITLETTLEKLLTDVDQAREILKNKHAAEKTITDLGAPVIVKPTEKPPVFNPNMATLSDAELGNQLGTYSAWAGYLKNFIALREIDVMFTKQAIVKTQRLLVKKYRATGSSASQAEDLASMDTTVLALQDLYTQFEIERRLADGSLAPYQDYIKALSREITRRAPDRFGGSGKPPIEGEAFTGTGSQQ